MPIAIGPGISIGPGVAVSTPAPAPVITIVDQPPNISTYPTDTATFNVNATVTLSASLSYQWQVLPAGSGTWENIDGATTNLVNIGPLSTGDNGNYYRCVVSATGGATPVTSNGGLLTVEAAVITIDTQPTNQSAAEGETATFSVSASVTTFATLEYQWYVQPGGSGSFESIPSATNSSYTTPTLSSGDNNNNYNVTVSADHGASPVISNTVSLTVTAGGGVGNGPFVAGVDYTIPDVGPPGLSVGGPSGGPYNITLFDSAWINTAARDAIYAKAQGTAFVCIIGGVTTTVTTTSAWTNFGPGQYASVDVSSPPSGSTTSISMPTVVAIDMGSWGSSGQIQLPVDGANAAAITAMDGMGANKTLTLTDQFGDVSATISGTLTKLGPFGPSMYVYSGTTTSPNPNYPSRMWQSNNPILSVTL